MFVCTHVRQALQQAVTIGEFSAARLASGRSRIVVRSSMVGVYAWPDWQASPVKPIALALVALALGLAGCQTSPEERAADTDISIQTTDIESLSVGTEQQCVERLTKVVDVDYLREHDVVVEDEGSARFAIENAISDVCADADLEQEVHEAAHEVVHEVEERLGD
jgi:hypothetical protein